MLGPPGHQNFQIYQVDKILNSLEVLSLCTRKPSGYEKGGLGNGFLGMPNSLMRFGIIRYEFKGKESSRGMPLPGVTPVHARGSQGMAPRSPYPCVPSTMVCAAPSFLQIPHCTSRLLARRVHIETHHVPPDAQTNAGDLKCNPTHPMTISVRFGGATSHEEAFLRRRHQRCCNMLDIDNNIVLINTRTPLSRHCAFPTRDKAVSPYGSCCTDGIQALSFRCRRGR